MVLEACWSVISRVIPSSFDVVLAAGPMFSHTTSKLCPRQHAR